jgi:hypothetical protein
VDVVVYKLTVEGTVEERILELQDKKRLLAEQAIEGGMKKGALKLGLQEMLGLFRHEGGRISSGLGGVGGGGGGELADDAVVRQDLGYMMTGLKKAPARKREGAGVYDRRW